LQQKPGFPNPPPPMDDHKATAGPRVHCRQPGALLDAIDKVHLQTLC
jgi:hypothetical protein